MTVTTRRRILATAALGLAMPAVVTRPARAATVWRLASKQPAESSEGKVYQRFADLAKEYSGGALEVQIYPSEQLGKEAAVLEQLQLGTVHLFLDDPFYMQRWVPDVKWATASFLFESRAQWVRFMDGPLFRDWVRQVTSKVGIMTLPDLTEVVRGPFRVLAATRAVQSLAELQGLRIRMYPDELATAVWNHLGVETRLLAWTDAYQAIRTGVVQGVTAPIGLVQDMKFQEVAPFIMRTNEYFQAIAFMTNARAFDRLSAVERDALLRAHRDAGRYSATLMQAVADEATASLAQRGATYLEPDVAPIVEKARAFYEQLDREGKVPAGYFDAVRAARG